jgi:hypothetical protein
MPYGPASESWCMHFCTSKPGNDRVVHDILINVACTIFVHYVCMIFTLSIRLSCDVRLKRKDFHAFLGGPWGGGGGGGGD